MGLFDKCKPLIGVVHLPPLPGSYGYRRRPFPFPRGPRYSIDEIVEYAVNEAKKYHASGFDAVIVENFGDKPYKQTVGQAEAAAMARVVAEVVKSVPIPVGVNVLRNSPYTALVVAHVSGASFIRVNSLCETRYAVEGIITPSMHQLAEAARELDVYDDILTGKIEVIADINVKHSYPVHAQGTDYNLVVKDCIERSGIPLAGMIITSPSTGVAPDVKYVEDMSNIIRSHHVPVIIGSGVKPENIARYWRLVDGFIVGTSVKLGEMTENVVQMERAQRLAQLVKRYREVWPCSSR
ncbi:MAG: BtpA/SgcQ family protein [Desulfurococcales archaeon]|nr:BtpA/SgcQ family protein [Desulfurococcales archaeon]